MEAVQPPSGPHTGATSASALEVKEGRLSFPLPPELRHEIYDLLVAVPCKAVSGQAEEQKVYCFYTELFNINKTIRDDALNYFHRAYNIVQFQFSIPDADAVLDAFELPIVITPLPRRLSQNHTLNVHAQVSRVNPAYLSFRWVYLLAYDISALCNLLQFLTLNTSARFLSIDTARSATIRPELEQLAGPGLTISVTARHTAAASLEPHQQITFLNKLRQIKGGDVDVKFWGFADRATLGATCTQAVARAIRPSLVWPRAREWAVFEFHLSLKKRADSCLESSALVRAQSTYDVLRRQMLEDHAADITKPASHPDDPVRDRAAYLRKVLYIDVSLSLVQVEVRAGLPRNAMRKMNAVSAITPNPAPTLNMHINRLALATKLLLAIDESVSRWAAGLRRIVPDVEGLCQRFPADLSLPLMRNDLEIAQEILRAPLTRSAISEPLRSQLRAHVSVNSMPLPTIDSLSPEEEFGRPAGLDGWEDVAHKQALSASEKVTILAL